MKTSARLRVWFMVTGVLLGLLASIGLAAPAGASSVAVPASHSHEDKGGHGDGDATLTLRIYHDGDYKVKGEDYEAKRVHVWIVNVSKHYVVDHFYVKTRHGDFKIHDDGLRCGKTYKAVSYSKADGWVSSDKVYFKCKDKDNGHD